MVSVCQAMTAKKVEALVRTRFHLSPLLAQPDFLDHCLTSVQKMVTIVHVPN